MEAVAVDPIVFRLTVFVLAIFVGYFVVWSVTPALHTPLMSVTNAISSVIVVGALIAVAVTTTAHGPAATQYAGGAPQASGAMVPLSSYMDAVSSAATAPQSAAHAWTSKLLGFAALILACVNIFGGFLVTARMLAMYKKKGAK